MSDDEGLPTLEEIDRFMRDTVRSAEMHDQTVSMLEDRITDLEEIVYARWPRSLFAARRLRRKIKASISGVPGATFADRRAEAIGYELAQHDRPQ